MSKSYQITVYKSQDDFDLSINGEEEFFGNGDDAYRTWRKYVNQQLYFVRMWKDGEYEQEHSPETWA